MAGSGENDKMLSSSTHRRQQQPPAYDPNVAPSLNTPVRTFGNDTNGAGGVGRAFSAPDISAFDQLYRRGGELGLGAFAQVFLGTHIPTGAPYAIKKIDRSKMVWGNRDALVDEISNLTYLREGPNIVQLYEVYYEEQEAQQQAKRDRQRIYQSQSYCYLVMELMRGGELFDRILEKKIFSETEARDCCRGICRGLAYMHKKRVAHRDLKPENLLLSSLDSNTDIKLADFGFARRVPEINGCRTLCGTPGYLAPEILERWPAYDVKCDLWSVGVILFLLLGGYLPFEEQEEDKVFERTRNGQYDFHPDYWKGVSAGAKNLITKFLTVNPATRYSAQDALDYQGWMTNNGAPPHDAMPQQQQPMLSAATMATTGSGAGGAPAIKSPPQHIKNNLKELKDNFAGYLERQNSHSRLQKDKDNTGRRGVNRTLSAMNRNFVEDSVTGAKFAEIYVCGDVLGEGGYACVYRAQHIHNKQYYAVKDIDTTVLENSSKSALRDEIAALKLLRGGPHIIRLFDVFEELEHTYLIMQEMKGGDLLTRITEKEVYTEREARKTCKILFEAMDFIHKKKIAHRDIKPENVLMVEADNDHSIKIADFGFAKRVSKANCLRTLCGTAQYVAPEVLDLDSIGYDHRADMWSVGVVTYILLGGYAPFEGEVQELARAICKGDYTFHDKYWKDISEGAKNMISALLQIDVEQRLSAEEALQCPWMRLEEETLTARDLPHVQMQLQNRKPADNTAGLLVSPISKENSIDIDLVKGLGGTNQQIMDRMAQRTGGPAGFGRAGLGAVDEDATYVSKATIPATFDDVYEWGDSLFEAVDMETDKVYAVHEAMDIATEKVYAVKRIGRTFLDAADAVAVQDEITALQMLVGGPHIIQLHDVYEEPDYTYMVMDLLRGGELIERLHEKECYTENEARSVIKKVLLGVEHCHNHRIAIRNLKTENLILAEEGSITNVKISDFGFAKKVRYPNALQTQCGTEGYVAPEILEHRPAYDVQCDMWSVGVILFMLLGGYRPFRGEPDEVMRQIRYGEYKFHKRYWKNIDDEAKILITRMLTVIPIGRITATAALQSHWIAWNDSNKKNHNYYHHDATGSGDGGGGKLDHQMRSLNLDGGR